MDEEALALGLVVVGFFFTVAGDLGVVLVEVEGLEGEVVNAILLPRVS